MNRTRQFGFAVALLGASLLGLGQAAAFPCEKEIRAKLAKENITKSSIASVRVIREVGEEDVFEGYEVWTRVRSCKGQYIMSLSESCYVSQGYSRLSCMAGSGRPRR